MYDNSIIYMTFVLCYIVIYIHALLYIILQYQTINLKKYEISDYIWFEDNSVVCFDVSFHYITKECSKSPSR